MGMDFIPSSRKCFFAGLVLLLIPAISVLGCSKKRETTTSQTVTGRVTRIVDQTPSDGPVTIVVQTDHGDSTVLHFASMFTNPRPSEERTRVYQTIRTVKVGSRVEALASLSDGTYEIQSITVTQGDTSGSDMGTLDTGRAPTPPVRSNPTEIKIADAGQTFTYHVGDKFTVLLDGNSYPQAHLSFEPSGVITLDSSSPPATAPNYAAAFVATAPGEAVLKNGSFVVTIRIVS